MCGKKAEQKSILYTEKQNKQSKTEGNNVNTKQETKTVNMWPKLWLDNKTLKSGRKTIK